MKPTRRFKWVSGISAAILLSLAAGMAISSVDGLDIHSGKSSIAGAMQQLFEEWQGSRTMIALAVLCLILVIAGRGIERP